MIIFWQWLIALLSLYWLEKECSTFRHASGDNSSWILCPIWSNAWSYHRMHVYKEICAGVKYVDYRIWHNMPHFLIIPLFIINAHRGCSFDFNTNRNTKVISWLSAEIVYFTLHLILPLVLKCTVGCIIDVLKCTVSFLVKNSDGFNFSDLPLVLKCTVIFPCKKKIQSNSISEKRNTFGGKEV